MIRRHSLVSLLHPESYSNQPPKQRRATFLDPESIYQNLSTETERTLSPTYDTFSTSRKAISGASVQRSDSSLKRRILRTQSERRIAPAQDAAPPTQGWRVETVGSREDLLRRIDYSKLDAVLRFMEANNMDPFLPTTSNALRAGPPPRPLRRIHSERHLEGIYPESENYYDNSQEFRACSSLDRRRQTPSPREYATTPDHQRVTSPVSGYGEYENLMRPEPRVWSPPPINQKRVVRYRQGPSKSDWASMERLPCTSETAKVAPKPVKEPVKKKKRRLTFSFKRSINDDMEYGPGIVEKLKAKFHRLSGLTSRDVRVSPHTTFKRCPSLGDVSVAEEITSPLPPANDFVPLSPRHMLTSKSTGDMFGEEDRRAFTVHRHVRIDEPEEDEFEAPNISTLRHKFEQSVQRRPSQNRRSAMEENPMTHHSAEGRRVGFGTSGRPMSMDLSQLTSLDDAPPQRTLKLAPASMIVPPVDYPMDDVPRHHTTAPPLPVAAPPAVTSAPVTRCPFCLPNIDYSSMSKEECPICTPKKAMVVEFGDTENFKSHRASSNISRSSMVQSRPTIEPVVVTKTAPVAAPQKPFRVLEVLNRAPAEKRNSQDIPEFVRIARNLRRSQVVPDDIGYSEYRDLSKPVQSLPATNAKLGLRGKVELPSFSSHARVIRDLVPPSPTEVHLPADLQSGRNRYFSEVPMMSPEYVPVGESRLAPDASPPPEEPRARTPVVESIAPVVSSVVIQKRTTTPATPVPSHVLPAHNDDSGVSEMQRLLNRFNQTRDTRFEKEDEQQLAYAKEAMNQNQFTPVVESIAPVVSSVVIQKRTTTPATPVPSHVLPAHNDDSGVSEMQRLLNRFNQTRDTRFEKEDEQQLAYAKEAMNQNQFRGYMPTVVGVRTSFGVDSVTGSSIASTETSAASSPRSNVVSISVRTDAPSVVQMNQTHSHRTITRKVSDEEISASPTVSLKTREAPAPPPIAQPTPVRPTSINDSIGESTHRHQRHSNNTIANTATAQSTTAPPNLPKSAPPPIPSPLVDSPASDNGQRKSLSAKYLESKATTSIREKPYGDHATELHISGPKESSVDEEEFDEVVEELPPTEEMPSIAAPITRPLLEYFMKDSDDSISSDSENDDPPMVSRPTGLPLLAGDGNPVRHTLLSLVMEEDIPELLEAMGEQFSFEFTDVASLHLQKPSTSSILHPPELRKKRRSDRKVSGIRFESADPPVYLYIDEVSAITSEEWSDGALLNNDAYQQILDDEQRELELQTLKIQEYALRLQRESVEAKQANNNNNIGYNQPVNHEQIPAAPPIVAFN